INNNITNGTIANNKLSIATTSNMANYIVIRDSSGNIIGNNLVLGVTNTTTLASTSSSNIAVNLPPSSSTLATLDLSETFTGAKTFTSTANFTGKLVINRNLSDYQALQILSGSTANWIGMTIGRAVGEGFLGIPSGNSEFALDAIAGDLVISNLNQFNRILFATGL